MQFKAKGGLLQAYSAPASNSGKNVMVGLDAVRDQLLHMLTGEPSGHLRVIPLMGMGGIGKTTLAKNAYQHLYIQHHFDVRLWATISQQFSVETILRQQLSTTGEELHKKLWGRRYLIVLDDMWSVEAWNEIQMFLPDNGNGSCVIVTTRLSNLAHNLSSPPIEMNFLDEDKSWELFCRESFGQEKCPLELEKIGRKIVKRCRGLPLSIIVIAGHLRKSSRAIEYWEKVGSLMNPISSSVEDEQCLQIISLSYHHLPAYLKPCFLYMGIYAEDEWIEASKLLKFWVVEGFLKQNKPISLEEVAENYLKDLIDRNLILVRERSWNRKAKYCGMHDIVRELCLKVAKKEKFMHVLEGRKQARSRKIYIGMHNEIVGSHFQLLNLRYLHVYLDSQITEKCCIFSSISLFWNLKTLIIRNNHCQIIVPYEIWEMPQLRHMEFSKICLPNPLANEEECNNVLQNLHTLIGVENLELTEEVCKRIPNIKNLSLLYNDLQAISYCCPHNLGRFNKLESLMCSFYGGHDSKWRDFVASFTFPSSLLELSLANCQLHWEDLATMIKSFPNLEALNLFPVKGIEFNPVDEFPRLKKLEISFCDDLIHWNANSSHFPQLEILHIGFAPKLSEIPLDIGEIPTLRRVILNWCSVSAAISAMRIVVEQESFGNEDLQLEVHFKDMEEVERFQKMMREKGLRSNRVHLSVL